MAKTIDISAIKNWREIDTVDHFYTNRITVLKDGDLRGMVKLIRKMRVGEIPVNIFYLDGMYIYIFFMDLKDRSESKYINAFSSTQFTNMDIGLMIYDEFFNINDVDCQMVMIAHEIGHFKTTYFRGPQYGYDRRRREYLRRGDVAPDEIDADKYGHKYVPYKYKECLLKMADHADQNGNFHPNASKEMRLRASKMYR